jgi:hypothetical protein
MIMRVERMRLHRHRRMRRSRDARPAGLRHDAIGVRADGRWLSSEDDAGVSTSAAAGDEYGCESYWRERTDDG